MCPRCGIWTPDGMFAPRYLCYHCLDEAEPMPDQLDHHLPGANRAERKRLCTPFNPMDSCEAGMSPGRAISTGLTEPIHPTVATSAGYEHRRPVVALKVWDLGYLVIGPHGVSTIRDNDV